MYEICDAFFDNITLIPSVSSKSVLCIFSLPEHDRFIFDKISAIFVHFTFGAFPSQIYPFQEVKRSSFALSLSKLFHIYVLISLPERDIILEDVRSKKQSDIERGGVTLLTYLSSYINE